MYNPIITLKKITIVVNRKISVRVGQTTFFNSSNISLKNVTGAVMFQYTIFLKRYVGLEVFYQIQETM